MCSAKSAGKDRLVRIVLTWTWSSDDCCRHSEGRCRPRQPEGRRVQRDYYRSATRPEEKYLLTVNRTLMITQQIERVRSA